jgi:hypothetical protein
LVWFLVAVHNIHAMASHESGEGLTNVADSRYDHMKRECGRTVPSRYSTSRVARRGTEQNQ